MRTANVKLPGHPDKACDLVAEAILDEYLRRDPNARARISVMGGRGAIFVCGDILSQADFDVAALIQRTLGKFGAAEMEPFVSLEQVPTEQVRLFAAGPIHPVVVTGYATDETPELIPKTLKLARRIAKELEELRNIDESWYWLGADGQAEVFAPLREPQSANITIEHGDLALEEARKRITALVQGIAPGLKVRVNLAGSNELRGLGKAVGRCGTDVFAYGDAMPPSPPSVGLDLRQPEKSGAWLARQAARRLINRGARSALVRAVYEPGQTRPVLVQARDERGRDMSLLVSHAELDLEAALQWWRTDLNADAARWGYAGEAGMPWEG